MAGYHVGTNIIGSMQDYAKLIEDQMDAHKKYAANRKLKIRQQPTLSSYNTTRQAQLQTIDSSVQLVGVLQISRNAITVVIKSYQKKLEDMYPKIRFHLDRPHIRSKRMEQEFHNEYSVLLKAEQKVQALKDKHEKIQEAIDQAKADIQNQANQKTVKQSHISKAKEGVRKKEEELKTIGNDITAAENAYQQAQVTYRQKVHVIYLECRELEEQRLNDIQEVSLQFLQAIHSTEFFQKQNQIYNRLIERIKNEQSTIADLDFWGRTYRVIPADPSDNPEHLPITTCNNTDESNVIEVVQSD